MRTEAETYEDYVYTFTTKSSEPFEDTNTNTKNMNKKEIHELLESIYKANPYPTKQARLEIAKELNIFERKIQIWFQNRRAKEKSKDKGTSKPINHGLQWIVNANSTDFQQAFLSTNSNKLEHKDSSTMFSKFPLLLSPESKKYDSKPRPESNKMGIDFLLQ